MNELIFNAVFESLHKDKDGEIKVTFTVPLSDEHLVRGIPVQQVIKLAVINEYHETRENS